MKIKYKMIGLFIVSIFISVIFFLLITYGLLNKGYLAGITPEQMREAVQMVANEMNTKEDIEIEETKKILQKANETYFNMCFSILLSSGETIDGGKYIGIHSQQELISKLSQNTQYQSAMWIEVKEIAYKEEMGYLIVAADKEYFRTITYYFNGPRAKGVLGKIILMGLVLTLVISTLVMYLFTRKIMKRIVVLDHAIDEFELGNLHVRIAEDKNDEIGKLSHSFNDMANKIEEQVKVQEEYEEKRKQLVSNLSHDLRTPLASVVGYSELLLEGLNEERDIQRYMEIIHRKAIYMEKLLNQLLEFSRLENGTWRLNLGKADIVECIREVLIEYIPILDEKI